MVYCILYPFHLTFTHSRINENLTAITPRMYNNSLIGPTGKRFDFFSQQKWKCTANVYFCPMGGKRETCF